MKSVKIFLLVAFLLVPTFKTQSYDFKKLLNIPNKLQSNDLKNILKVTMAVHVISQLRWSYELIKTDIRQDAYFSAIGHSLLACNSLIMAYLSYKVFNKNL